MGIFSRFKKQKPAEASATEPAVEPAVVPAVSAPAVSEKGKKRGDAWRILVRPLVSEKAANAGAHNQYVFVVADKANKIDVKEAIADVYGVRPIKVNMVRLRGKKVRYGRSQGKTKAWKKAIVTLPKGKKIQIYEGV